MIDDVKIQFLFTENFFLLVSAAQKMSTEHDETSLHDRPLTSPISCIPTRQKLYDQIMQVYTPIQDNGNRAVLRRVDAEYLIDLNDEVSTWFSEVKDAVKCQNEDNLSVDTFNKQSVKKSVLAELLGDVCSILRKQQDMVRDLQAANDIMKTDLIDCQSSTIKLQNEILLCKSEQFQSIKKAVKCTVQRTVQSELKSCSSVVADNLQSPTIAPETLKKVVQSVAEEEDRGKTSLYSV